jgi:hypothetical protein
LWIWVGVLVAGCGQLWSSDGTPTPTREPTLPLLGYTLLPPTLTPSIWPVRTATPRVTVDGGGLGVSPLALYLSVIGSACYETPVGSLVCLGQVRNTLDVPIEHVTVGVQLLARDGALLEAKEAFVSRWMLPAGATGPYRVLFEQVPNGYAGTYAFVVSGQIAQSVEHRFATLTLQEVSGRFLVDQYQVSLSVLNKGPYAAQQLAITMTLLDAHGQVTGFRRVYLAADRRLEPGESLALTIKVIPQGRGTVAFEAFVEGYLASDEGGE